MSSHSDVVSGRLSAAALADNFSDLHPPLSKAQALIEADRCYFCYDAPCVTACPTGIDIPSFIRKIATDNIKGAAADILQANIMGGICARVCPTEVLCEGICVRNSEEPVKIGALQRYATDWLFKHDIQLFKRKADSGKKVAVVGAGPAGLSCAHRLSMNGHQVTVFEAKDKSGGLNEYGIAAYKVPGQFAQHEVDYILDLGGIEIQRSKALGRDFSLNELRSDYDAVFLGLGLGGVNSLELGNIESAVDYIATLRQTDDLATLPVGRRVVVIGGGSTAIDIAIQSKRLGAEDVTLVYRRGEAQMSATWKERDLAQTNGVKIVCWAKPVVVNMVDDVVQSVTFERTDNSNKTFVIDADSVFAAIGQSFDSTSVGSDVQLDKGRIAVDADYRTSLNDVWAGGDCIAGGNDLTVTAVEHGKLAAHAIDRVLSA